MVHSSKTDMLPFETLRKEIAESFPAIEKARKASEKKISKIRSVVADAHIELNRELSLVVFGSLARREWTSGSDVDWTLLVDGPVDPSHFQVANRIRKALEKAQLLSPGPTNIFGTLASSHDLVHHIGGNEDTNQNMTRRLLLLLESLAIVDREDVRERVVRAILNRYILWGRGIPSQKDETFRVPRFLLNDIVRFWRTMAVDYAAKKWERQDEGWALRNAKLRVSRKLTFVKGLLLCFDCELFKNDEPWKGLLKTDHGNQELVEEKQIIGTMDVVELSPLDALSRFFLRTGGERAKPILAAYDGFLSLMDDKSNRDELEKLSIEDIDECDVFSKVRTEIGEKFGTLLVELFFESEGELSNLTRKYGVF